MFGWFTIQLVILVGFFIYHYSNPKPQIVNSLQKNPWGTGWGKHLWDIVGPMKMG